MKVFKLLLLIFSCGFFSCASIPKEAPVLSEQLGQEITELEKSHFSLVDSFFELKRKNVKNYIENVWLPLYAKNFFEEPGIRKVWEQISNLGSEEDRLKFLLKTAPQLQADINAYYEASVVNINRLEKKLKEALREKYTNARSVNNTLTSFLSSASEVDENRQRYLNMTGLSSDKIEAAIDQTEVLTAKFLKGALEAEDKLEGAEEKLQDFNNGINNLINKIK